MMQPLGNEQSDSGRISFPRRRGYSFAARYAYAFHIAENQPFVDGNKRTALVAPLIFLDWHNVETNNPGEELYKAMIHLAEKKLDKPGLAILFENLATTTQE